MTSSKTSFKSRMQLELLSRVSKKRRGSEGFTLIELLIVVAIVSVLAAIALPQFLGARDAAVLGAAVGEAVGLSKECAVFAASDIDTGVTAPLNTAITYTTACTAAGGEMTVNAANTTPAMSTAEFRDGMRCINDEAAGGETTAVITIGPAGETSCVIS